MWYLAADTERGVLEKPELLVEQKSIELKERSIALLVGREKAEEKNESSKTFLHNHET